MQTNPQNKAPQTQRRSILLALACVALTAGLNAQSVPAATPAADEKKVTVETEQSDEVVTLSPFEVTEDSNIGYTATQTLAGSRINSKMEDVGSAITVITQEFLKDVGATDNKSLLSYTTNTEVGGAQGNFKGASGGQNEDESGRFINPNGSTRVRGLSAADNTRNFFMSDIPWEGYNTDRIDMQRGANSILFGLGSPAGIINATTRTAQHGKNFGEVNLRYGSHGSNRVALDYNHNLLPKELSFRIDILRNHEKYRQDPAYSLDRRVFGTLRYDPKFLNKNGHKTTFKAYAESGNINSNNPRTITPIDCITGWWTKLDKATYNPSRVHDTGRWYDADHPEIKDDTASGYYPTSNGQFNAKWSNGSTNAGFEPWLGAPSFYGGVWFMANPGETSLVNATMPEYRNIKGVNSSGKIDGGISGLPFARRVTVATSAYYAERDTGLFGQKWGVYKSTTLSDPSVFDFYNNLIEGDNKREWQKFRDHSGSVTQTFFNDKFGFEIAYDKQEVQRGQYGFNGSGPLYIDINSHNLDGSVNANVGRPYIESSYTWGNSVTDTVREQSRISTFFSHNFAKAPNSAWWKKLLGRHTLSNLYSREENQSDGRSMKRYGTTQDFGAMMANGTNGSYFDSNDRAVSTTIYLGDSLLNRTSASGSYVPRAQAAVALPQQASFRYFDSTWKGTGVDPAATYTLFNGAASTQSENPANYVGWKTTNVDILSAENGDIDQLWMGGTLNRRKVESKAAVLQSYFWDGMVVGMYGIRNDRVKTQEKSTARDAAVTNMPMWGDYSLQGRPITRYEQNSPSWSVVAKPTKLLPDGFPVNISFYYNSGSNFQVSFARNDIYGRAIPLPTGSTLDRGIMISTKNEKLSLRINHYETKVNMATNTTGMATWFLLGGGNFIQRNEDRADAYEYHLATLGDPKSAEGTPGWQWRYTPDSSKNQTQEQADAIAAAAVAAWRKYTAEPIVQNILKAWGFNDFNKTQLTTMATPVGNFYATEDQISKGWEYELTANPTKNWRVSINASETKAMRKNIGGEELSAFIDLTNTYQNGPMGDIRQWGGGSIGSTSLVSWNGNFYSKYALMKLQEGTFSSELRKWRYNVVSNYSFSSGFAKGFNVGVGYRWEDKIALGYPMKNVTANTADFDLDNPYYGPTNDAIDLWVGYNKKISKGITWNVQLNVRNLGDSKRLIPLSVQPDGTTAAYGIAPYQTWTLTNSFKF